MTVSVKLQRWASWPFPGFLPACLKRTWLRALGNVCAEHWECTGIYSVPLLILILLEFHSHGQLATYLFCAGANDVHSSDCFKQSKQNYCDLLIYLFIRILTVEYLYVHKYAKFTDKSTLHYRSYRLNVLFMCWFFRNGMVRNGLALSWLFRLKEENTDLHAKSLWSPSPKVLQDTLRLDYIYC